jgi:hypothetical protein
VPDRRQAAYMCHGSQGMGVALVGLHRRGCEKGPVELPDLENSFRVRVLPLLPKGLQGGQVPGSGPGKAQPAACRPRVP